MRFQGVTVVASLARSRLVAVEVTGAYEISPWFYAVRPRAAPRYGSTGALAVALALAQVWRSSAWR